MNFNNIIIGIFGVIVFFSFINSCSRPPAGRQRQVQNQSPQIETRTIMPGQDLVAAADQFDLRVLESLLKESKDGAELERKLNATEPRVHNLDLNEDEVVDYIQVTEYGSGDKRGLSLTTELAPENGEPQVQEIANITMEKTADQKGQYEVKGNEAIYGQNHYHRGGFGFTDFLLMGWLFSNHSPFNSGARYGNYPDHYNRHRTDYDAYRRDSAPRANSSGLNRGSSSTISGAPASPNAGRNATNVRAPLRNPTATQRSFQARNPSRTVRSGGFGNRSTDATSTRSTSSSRPSVRSSGGSRSGSFRGGGK